MFIDTDMNLIIGALKERNVSNRSGKQLAQLIVVLLCALTLKQYYSTANVNELRWILAPTTVLVELVSGSRFEFESYAGYINSDRSFVIAANQDVAIHWPVLREQFRADIVKGRRDGH